MTYSLLNFNKTTIFKEVLYQPKQYKSIEKGCA